MFQTEFILILTIILFDEYPPLLDLTPVRQLTILMGISQKSNDMNRRDYAL